MAGNFQKSYQGTSRRGNEKETRTDQNTRSPSDSNGSLAPTQPWRKVLPYPGKDCLRRLIPNSVAPD